MLEQGGVQRTVRSQQCRPGFGVESELEPFPRLVGDRRARLSSDDETGGDNDDADDIQGGDEADDS